MNIAFIPIDNRPVCYLLPKQIADIDENINLILPERKFLGGLTEYSDVKAIFGWLKNLSDIDAVIMCLDTIAYGGLISSRRCPENFEEIKTRIFKLKEILKEKNAKIYAFSSIMRISNNNINQEEKEYWKDWGKKIFEYSYNFHKNGSTETDIPQEILDDYLKTRKRNFEINKIYLEWQKEGFFDTLVFSKDDCAEFGLNVTEAQELERLGGFVKTGADEIPMTLLARAISEDKRVRGLEDKSFNSNCLSKIPRQPQTDTALSSCGFADGRNEVSPDSEQMELTGTECRKRYSVSVEQIQDNRPIALSPDNNHTSIKIAPIFLAPEHKHLISNYEDVSIEKSVLGQLELAGCEVVEPKDADILLYINNFEDHQGEIVMNVPTKLFEGKFPPLPTPPLRREEGVTSKPYLIADVRFANGSDNAFVEKLFENGFDENFLGYSAWNTSANTLGSLICQGVIAEGKRIRGTEEWQCSEEQKFGGQDGILDDWRNRGIEDWLFTEEQRTGGQEGKLFKEIEQRSVIADEVPQIRYSPIRLFTDKVLSPYRHIALSSKNNHTSIPPYLLPSIITRFLDDWAYQANVRQMLTEPDSQKCKEFMKPFEEKLWKIFGVQYNVNYRFPWNRLFEVEIELS